MRTAIVICLLCLAAAGCTTTGAVDRVRYHNRAPVWRVDDRRDVPKRPATRDQLPLYRWTLQVLYRPVNRKLAMPDSDLRRAVNVNSLGEVPDSTWFTNRIGRRPMPPDEIRRGPTDNNGPPDLSAPLKVMGAKPKGGAVGFVVEDRRAIRYIIKLDEPEFPITESATHVPVQRILWAAGYNVPNDGILSICRDQLEVGKNATIESRAAGTRPLTSEDIDRILSEIVPDLDGNMRGLYSEFLPGVPVGGFADVGTRDDDPNDTVPHQLRRELRGLELLASWLQHTDMRTFNTLDVWVEDPEVPERRYIVHYLIDFGKALGAFVNLGPRYEDGHAHVADPHVFRSLLTLGLWKRPWEYARDPDITGVGTFDVQSYRPGDFATQRLYWPFVVADEYDRLWAARIMLRFTEAHIRAALEAGQHVDPRAVEYLTAVLIGRQRKGARYWLRRVNPLVDPTLSADGQTLCVTDLLVAHGLERRAVNGSRYRARAYDYAGRELGSSQTLEHRDGTICASGFGRGRLEQGYTIVRFDTLRPGRRHRPVEIHLAEAAGGQRRVIGVNRR